jgi:hypothetical protein
VKIHAPRIRKARDAMGGGRTFGMQIPRQETQPDLKPNTPSISSAFEFVAVDAVRFVSKRYGLTPGFAAVVTRCAGMGGGAS